MRIYTAPLIRDNGEMYAINFKSIDQIQASMSLIKQLPDASISIEDIFTQHIQQVITPKNSYIVGSDNGHAYTNLEDAIQYFLKENINKLKNITNNAQEELFLLNKTTFFLVKPISSRYKEIHSKLQNKIKILTDIIETLSDIQKDTEHPLREKIPITLAPEYLDIEDSIWNSFLVDKELYYFKFNHYNASADFKKCSIRFTGFNDEYKPHFELFNVEKGYSMIEIRELPPANVNGVVKISGLTTDQVVFDSKENALEYLEARKARFEESISKMNHIIQEIS